MESGCVPRQARRGILGAVVEADGETASQNIAIIAKCERVLLINIRLLGKGKKTKTFLK